MYHHGSCKVLSGKSITQLFVYCRESDYKA